jgi:hypothetical protein
MREYRPDWPGHLVRQRDRSQLGRPSRLKLLGPRSAMLPVEVHAARAVDQQRAHAWIATPTDAQQLALAAGANLFWGPSQARQRIPALI